MIKVTIGLPTFNRAKLLKRAIEQMLAQSFQDFELIIYNDGSTDDTAEVVKSINDPRIKFISEINKGLPHPLNKILDIAIGEYIIIIHDHDKFHPELIEKSVKALSENPNSGFVLQGCAWINSDEVSGYQELLMEYPFLNNGKEFGKKILLNPQDFSSPIHACCMVRKSAYEKVGKYYDEKFGWYTDIDLWLRLLIEYDFIYLKEVLFTFTGREKNHILSTKAFDVINWMYLIHLKHISFFFSDKADFDMAELIIKRKMKKALKRTLLYTVYMKDERGLTKSLNLYSNICKDNFIDYIILNLFNLQIFRGLLSVAASIYSAIKQSKN
jgi:glycosyltransferase involved in cell wall biosynthesis